MNLKKLKKTFVIAEIGNNHEGSFNVACKLIEEAKNKTSPRKKTKDKKKKKKKKEKEVKIYP